MYQGRIVDILVVLMDEIKSGGMKNEHMEVLSSDLMKRGYSEQEISTAFSWILERVVVPEGEISPGRYSFRVLHDIEKIFISKEAFGFLIQLASIGMLSHSEIEQVIEAALMESSPGLSVDKIKALIADVILGDSDSMIPGSDIFIPDDFLQ